MGLLRLFISFQTLMPLGTEDDGSQLQNPMEIPKELWMMVDYLHRHAAQEVGGTSTVRADGGEAALRESISPDVWCEQLLIPRTCFSLREGMMDK